MEKKIVPIPIDQSKAEIWAIFVNHFRNKRKTRITWILVGVFFLGANPLFAAETVKKENAFKQIASVEKRGLVNFLTTPAELVCAFTTEKKEHPKAWPITYVPRFFTNAAIRVGSSAHDILVLPWYAAAGDATPLTRRFELPDYAWQKE